MQLWESLRRQGILSIDDPKAALELFREYKTLREGKPVIDVRFLLKGVLSLVSEKVELEKERMKGRWT